MFKKGHAENPKGSIQIHKTFVQGTNHFTAATSASEVKASAKNASSGKEH
jgi:hypothetical protein